MGVLSGPRTLEVHLVGLQHYPNAKGNAKPCLTMQVRPPSSSEDSAQYRSDTFSRVCRSREKAVGPGSGCRQPHSCRGRGSCASFQTLTPEQRAEGERAHNYVFSPWATLPHPRAPHPLGWRYGDLPPIYHPAVAPDLHAF